MMPTGGVTYKTGLVAQSKPGFAKVRFDDIDGLISAWLPVIHPKTQNDKMVWTLDIGEQVACLMDSNMEDGCILGAIYSNADAPPVASSDKLHMQFKDGGSFEYDRSSGAMTVVCKGVLNATADGDATVRAPSITLDTPQTTCTGNLTVAGLLTYQGGMAGSGGSGSAASITGNVAVVGNVSVQGNVDTSGTVIDGGGNSNHHSHP